MKKKHFLFTSMAIAAILSANVAQAEETTSPVADPEKELVNKESKTDVSNGTETDVLVTKEDKPSQEAELSDALEQAETVEKSTGVKPEILDAKEKSISSESLETSLRSVDQPAMDIEAIKQGDYTSVFGTWESVSGAGKVTFDSSSFDNLKGLAIGESKELPVLGNDKFYPVYIERRLTEDGHVENIVVTSSGREVDWKFVPKGSNYTLSWRKIDNLQVADEDLVLGRMNGQFEYNAYRRGNSSLDDSHERTTKEGMDVEAIKQGDYSSVEGVWRNTNATSSIPYVTVSEHGFGRTSEVSYKGLKVGEKREVPNRYTWTRTLDESYGYPVDSIGFYGSEITFTLYVPKGMNYDIWDKEANRLVTKVASEDLIVKKGVVYTDVYTRATDIDSHYTVSAGVYGMGIVGDKNGYSVLDHKPVTITGKIGDTVDLNTVAQHFEATGTKIYRVTLTGPEGSKTLDNYQSSFVIDDNLKKYTAISISYDSPFVKKDDDRKTQDVQNKPLSDESITPTTAEQELIARVWKTLTNGRYPYTVSKRPAGTPINYHNGIGYIFPKETYIIAENSSRGYYITDELTFSDNGDGTITLYKVPKHWHIEDKDAERVTAEILNTAQIIKLDQLTKDEIATFIKLATSYTGFDEKDKLVSETPKERQYRIDSNLKLLRQEISRVDRALTYKGLSIEEIERLENFKRKRQQTIANLETTGELGQDNLDENDRKAFEIVLKLEASGVLILPQPGTPTPRPEVTTVLSKERHKLLLTVDQSQLTDQQKAQLAERIAFAETEQELAKIKVEVEKLVAQGTTSPVDGKLKALSSEAPRPSTSEAKAGLPRTGEQSHLATVVTGIGLFLSSLGLANRRKRF